MNNLIDRVNRLFSWKSQQYQQESSTSSSSSLSSPNEYQLQSPPNHQSTANANSWSNNTNSTNPITDTSNTRLFLANSNAHRAGSELRPSPSSHYSSSSFNNTNISNGDMSNCLQPLIETTSEYTSESSSLSSALILNQPSVAFSQPASRSNSTVARPTAAAAPLTSMNFTYGIRTNASEPSSSGGGGGGSNSNRHRIRHGRHHRSSRSSRSNRAHSNAITNSQNLRSFFTSSNRRSPPSLLSAPTGGPMTTGSTSNNVASNYNHHTTGAANSLNYLFDNIKKRERNIMSACCAIFTIAILSVSLIETRWFYLSGGGCNVNYIGVAHFFAPGRLESQVELSKITKTDIVMYNFVLPNGIGE